jgi:polar amino acid transport system substrate-binding protein
MAEVDRAGVRVIGISNTTTARAAARSLKNTTVTGVSTTEELLALLRDGKADAVALSRESLTGLSARFPGSRVLDGHFQATGVAIAVPKNHRVSLAFVSALIEDLKASGFVRRALDDAGLKDAVIAPPGVLQP